MYCTAYWGAIPPCIKVLHDWADPFELSVGPICYSNKLELGWSLSWSLSHLASFGRNIENGWPLLLSDSRVWKKRKKSQTIFVTFFKKLKILFKARVLTNAASSTRCLSLPNTLYLLNSFLHGLEHLSVCHSRTLHERKMSYISFNTRSTYFECGDIFYLLCSALQWHAGPLKNVTSQWHLN